MVPPAVRAAFDEGLDLHRAVTGSETSVASFIEALVAESLTEPQPSELACIEGRIESLMKGPDPEREEQALERAARGWPQLWFPARSMRCWSPPQRAFATSPDMPGPTAWS